MKSGTKLVLVVLWLAILGGAAYVWVFFLRGESTDKVEQEYRAAWQQAVEEGLDTPDIAEFGKRVNKSTRPELEKKLEEINQDMEKRFPRIPLAIDNFSGYCIFRSKEFHTKLAKQSIYLRLVNDNADYPERIKGIAEGQTKLAVYTIDALLNTSVKYDTPPASIVMVIDESKGADAVLAFKEAIPNAASLNQNDVKMVFTKGSPSETLARVVRSSYDPARILTSNMLPADDPPSIIKQIEEAAKVKDKSKDKRAFVLWEPDVSKMKNKYPGQLDVVVDSNLQKCIGKIVDIFVAEKKFLAEKPRIVEAIIQAYFDTYSEFERNNGLVNLVLEDAKKTGSPMEPDEAQSVVKGILWQTARDNYDYFRIDGSAKRPMEQMVNELNQLLIASNVYSAIKEPTHGNAGSLFDKGPLQVLFNGGFKPSDKVADSTLDDKQWNDLLTVNEIQLDRIDFRPGQTKVENVAVFVNPVLQQAKEILDKYPKYYLEVRGSSFGNDAEAAKQIASERAKWIASQLQELGVAGHRIRPALSSDMTANSKNRAVEFVLLQQRNK